MTTITLSFMFFLLVAFLLSRSMNNDDTRVLLDIMKHRGDITYDNVIKDSHSGWGWGVRLGNAVEIYVIDDLPSYAGSKIIKTGYVASNGERVVRYVYDDSYYNPITIYITNKIIKKLSNATEPYELMEEL